QGRFDRRHRIDGELRLGALEELTGLRLLARDNLALLAARRRLLLLRRRLRRTVRGGGAFVRLALLNRELGCALLGRRRAFFGLKPARIRAGRLRPRVGCSRLLRDRRLVREVFLTLRGPSLSL